MSKIPFYLLLFVYINFYAIIYLYSILVIVKLICCNFFYTLNLKWRIVKYADRNPVFHAPLAVGMTTGSALSDQF